MKFFLLLLLSSLPLYGSEFITFRSDEGGECTYRKFHLTVMSGVEAKMSPKGEYEHFPYIKIYVKDLDKMFPKLAKIHEDLYYIIYFEKKAASYKALKGLGPFFQKASTSPGSESTVTDIEEKNCQIILDRLLLLRLIPKPGEDTDKERLPRVIKTTKTEEKK